MALQTIKRLQVYSMGSIKIIVFTKRRGGAEAIFIAAPS
jgi:hypothetical protein